MDNIIQIGVAVGVIYAVSRWLLSGPFDPPAPRQRRQVPQEQIDAVLSAFPQVTENQARWDLGRSGSVELTIERIIRDGYLPDPPAGLFGPDPPRPAQTAARGTTTPAFASSKPNLITRFNLQSRIEESEDVKGKGKAVDPDEKGKAWSGSSDQRQDSLKERKAKMILDARRRILEKDRLAALNKGV